MIDGGGSPGPIADHTYETGFQIAAGGGLVGIVVLYWLGPLSTSNSVHLTITLTLFPVYLVFISILLAVWLGYDTDESDLRPVAGDEDTSAVGCWDGRLR